MLTLNEQPKQNNKNLKLILSAVASVGIIGAATSVVLSNGKSSKKSTLLDSLPEEFSATFKASHYNKYNNAIRDDYFKGKFNKWNDVDGEWSMEGQMYRFNARLERDDEDIFTEWTYLKDDKFFTINNTTLSCVQDYQHFGYALTKNALLKAQVLPKGAELDLDVEKRLKNDKNCGVDSERLVIQHPELGTILACVNNARSGLYGSVHTSSLQSTFEISNDKRHVIEVPKKLAPIDGQFLREGRECPKGNKFQSQSDYSDMFNKKYNEHVNHEFSVPTDFFPFKDGLEIIHEKRELKKGRERSREKSFGIPGGGKGGGLPTQGPVGGPVRNPLNHYNTQACKGPCPTNSPTTAYPTLQPVPPTVDPNRGWGIQCYWFHGAGNHKGFKKKDDSIWEKEDLVLSSPAHSTYSDSTWIETGMDVIENQTTVQERTRHINYQSVYSAKVMDTNGTFAWWYNTQAIFNINNPWDQNTTLYQAITDVTGQTPEVRSYLIDPIDMAEDPDYGGLGLGLYDGFANRVRKEITYLNGSACHLRLHNINDDKNYACLEAFYKYFIIGGSDHQGGVLGTQCGRGHFYYGNTAKRMHNNWDMMGETAEYLCGNRYCFFGANNVREVVFTHSYGGMLVMSAFTTGHVKKGNHGVIAMNQPPLKGSPGAEMVHHMCKDGWLEGIVKGAMQRAIWKIGYCNTNDRTDNWIRGWIPNGTNDTWKQGLRFNPQSYEFDEHPDGTNKWGVNYFVDYRYCGSNPCGHMGCSNLVGILALNYWWGEGRFMSNRSAAGLFNSSSKQCKKFNKCYEMYCVTKEERCAYRGCHFSVWGTSNNCWTGENNDYGTTLAQMHDGMVNVSSCKAKQPNAYFNNVDADNDQTYEGDEYSGSDYMGTDMGESWITIEQNNHEDGTGVNGNGYNISSQPVSWYMNVVREVWLGEMNNFNGWKYCIHPKRAVQEGTNAVTEDWECIDYGTYNGNPDAYPHYTLNKNEYFATRFFNFANTGQLNVNTGHVDGDAWENPDIMGVNAGHDYWDN